MQWEHIGNHIPPSSHIYIADARKELVLQKTFDARNPKILDLISSADSQILTKDEYIDNEKSKLDGGHDRDLVSDGKEVEEAEEEKWSEEQNKLYKKLPLTVVNYSDVLCSNADHVTVIVGGETEGISPQAKKFAFDHYGQFITIPMIEYADSLNTATAAAIILYEIRRQIVKKFQKNIHDAMVKI